jgi:hypothetical protein
MPTDDDRQHEKIFKRWRLRRRMLALVERLRPGFALGRCIVIHVLVIDRPVLDPGPARLAHRQPAAISVQAPGEHPFRLVFLSRNEMDGAFGKPLGSLVGFDVGDESVLVLVDIDAADLLDGSLHGRHCSLRCGFKDGSDQSVTDRLC